jgi:hypothetical protein
VIQLFYNKKKVSMTAEISKEDEMFVSNEVLVSIFRSLVNLIPFINNQNMKYTQMYYDYKMTDDCLMNA